MEQNQKHWNTTALVLLGQWLWEQGEYGHGLLCMHAPQWAFKIGTQLKVCWADVVNEEGECYVELNLPKEHARQISYKIKESIEHAYHMLPVVNAEDSLYMNYSTGKPLTSSTLNRELQRLSQKFLDYIKAKTEIELNYKPLKTNAFEIAWALDMVKKYHYSKQVFSAVSDHMGHRTIKDTIQLLEVEPNENIVFDFDNVKAIPDFMDTTIFEDENELKEFVFTEVVHDGAEWISIM